jgi:hypothetical protein
MRQAGKRRRDDGCGKRIKRQGEGMCDVGRRFLGTGRRFLGTGRTARKTKLQHVTCCHAGDSRKPVAKRRGHVRKKLRRFGYRSTFAHTRRTGRGGHGWWAQVMGTGGHRWAHVAGTGGHRRAQVAGTGGGHRWAPTSNHDVTDVSVCTAVDATPKPDRFDLDSSRPVGVERHAATEAPVFAVAVVVVEVPAARVGVALGHCLRQRAIPAVVAVVAAVADGGTVCVRCSCRPHRAVVVGHDGGLDNAGRAAFKKSARAVLRAAAAEPHPPRQVVGRARRHRLDGACLQPEPTHGVHVPDTTGVLESSQTWLGHSPPHLRIA